MRRGFAVLACLCVLTGCAYFAVSKWGIRHETLNLYDNARQRPVPVDFAVRWDYEMKANDGFWKLPVVIISNGNTVRNTEYAFLANVSRRGAIWSPASSRTFRPKINFSTTFDLPRDVRKT